MPPPLWGYITSPSLPQHCEPSSPFLSAISSHLHICLPTPLALISSLLGTCSIISWLFAQMPQIYKNYQLKSTSGLSLFFLVIWCLGDLGNLVGAIFTRQAGWQVVVAGYYVFVDVILVFQFFWYTHYRGRWSGYSLLSKSDDDEGEREFLDGVSLTGDDSVRYPPSVENTEASEAKDIKGPRGTISSTRNDQTPTQNEKVGSSRRSISRATRGPILPIVSPRTVLLTSMLCAVLANAAPTEQHAHLTAATEAPLMIVGRISSWMSTVLYLFSRPPQLYKNYRRKSTSGLSPLLFMAAFGGNLFYSSSILANPNAWYDFAPYGGGGWADETGNDRLEWVGRTIPFFLGAFGVLFLDGFMGVQFLMYGSKEDTVVEVEDPNHRGRSRWTKVRGWMRGWIPSVSPVRRSPTTTTTTTTTTPEGQALLTGDRARYGAV